MTKTARVPPRTRAFSLLAVSASRALDITAQPNAKSLSHHQVAGANSIDLLAQFHSREVP